MGVDGSGNIEAPLTGSDGATIRARVPESELIMKKRLYEVDLETLDVTELFADN